MFLITVFRTRAIGFGGAGLGVVVVAAGFAAVGLVGTVATGCVEAGGAGALSTIGDGTVVSAGFDSWAAVSTDAAATETTVSVEGDSALFPKYLLSVSGIVNSNP